MLKKVVGLLLVLIFVCGISAPVNASDATGIVDGSLFEIRPLWTMIHNVTNGLEINSFGKATMFSQITGYSGKVDSITILVYLQRYQNGSWVTVNSWMKGYEGSAALWSKIWYVNKGYYYRLTTFFYVYKGTFHESTVAISGAVYY